MNVNVQHIRPPKNFADLEVNLAFANAFLCIVKLNWLPIPIPTHKQHGTVRMS